MPYLFGPDLDPPAMQGAWRPAGVYETPDCRAGHEGCTAYEIWDHHHQRVLEGSVANHLAAAAGVRLWEFFDQFVDDQRAAVNDTTRARPRHLGLL